MRKKHVMIHKDDFEFFVQAYPNCKSHTERFRKIKMDTIKGRELTRIEKGLDMIGEVVVGKKMWKSMVKK